MVIRTYGSSGEVIYRGVLVDFGNAIYAGNRRLNGIDDHANACEDDARSANAYFSSLNAHASQRLVDAYRKAKRSLEKSNPGRRDYNGLKTALETINEGLLKHETHRYIDDLESLLYCFNFEVRFTRQID